MCKYWYVLLLIISKHKKWRIYVMYATSPLPPPINLNITHTLSIFVVWVDLPREYLHLFLLLRNEFLFLSLVLTVSAPQAQDPNKYIGIFRMLKYNFLLSQGPLGPLIKYARQVMKDKCLVRNPFGFSHFEYHSILF